MFKKLTVLIFAIMMSLIIVGCRGAAPAADPAPAPVETVADEPADDVADANDTADATQEDATPAEDNLVVVEGTEGAEWRIGIITGTVSQGEEEFFASQNMLARFGADRIVTATYPDRFNDEMEVTITNVLGLVGDGADAIVFVQAVPGTIASIERTREEFPDRDVFFFVGVTHEPPVEVAQHADIAMISDDLSMGRVIMEQAVAMGAETFAHISFPRHLGMENIARRRQLLEDTAAEFGIEFIDLTAPDPTGEAGISGTQMFILENIPRWVEEHGENTAFFSTNCAMQEPMMTQIARYGGLYPLQCCPSPFHAFPAAFNISMEGRDGDVAFLLEQTRAAVAEAGGTGRFSTWPVPINMLLVETGVMYSIEYLEGNIGRHDRAALTRIINDVASSFNTSVTLSNWPLDDGGYVENFYRVLSDFVTF